MIENKEIESTESIIDFTPHNQSPISLSISHACAMTIDETEKLKEAVKELNLTDPITKKPVSAFELITVLIDDVILAAERPGSWEGSNMIEVLRCHGFYQ